MGSAALLFLAAISSGTVGSEIVFAPFEGGRYDGWTTEGTAFGDRPASGGLVGQHRVVGFEGKGFVNSFHGGDDTTGVLRSPVFKLERRFISFLIGGGGWGKETCMNLVVDGKIVRTATGQSRTIAEAEVMEPMLWDVSKWLGKTARLEIVDRRKGSWGHITVDAITFRDEGAVAWENRKIWNRAWVPFDLGADTPVEVPLRFAFVANRATWRRPGGSVEPATGGAGDIVAAGFDVGGEVHLHGARELEVRLGGRSFCLAPDADGRVLVHIVLDGDAVRVLTPEGWKSFAPSGETAPTLSLIAHGGAAKVVSLEVFGLRSAASTSEEARLAKQAAQDDRVFYRSDSYTVYGGRVEDSVYGPPAAFVPDAKTIVSPTRVIEGFELNLDVWRPHPQGRVIDHETIWHPHPGIDRFPVLKSGWPTVDAAYGVALDVLHRNGADEFISDPGDRGQWQAGFFMGKTFGFGVWMRDSTHVALRMGNLLDPEVARRTLLRTTRDGIDNGCDGILMPIVGLWDYYLATGDLGAVREAWGNLKDRIGKIDAQFDPARGLVKAAHSTSNDAFSEPEAGGFALGTEAYFLLAYQAMAELGPLMEEDGAQVRAWKEREDLLRANIQREYWSESAGFFTTGPRGSEGYEKEFWESSGQELAIWPRFRIASPAQRRRVLDRLPEVAMNEFGVDVFPYRPEVDHFRGAGWVVWTSGMAAAANREGRLDVLEKLIGQQVRNAVLNKTFFEVVDYRSGRAWRWPGQLWQATGFLSYFYYGVLGMEYGADGLTLHPVVPKTFAGMSISGFRYRGAELEFKVVGWGSSGEVFLDGKRVERIPAGLVGLHRVELRMKHG